MTLLLPHHKIIPASEVSRKTIFQEVFSRRNFISIAIVLFVYVSVWQISSDLLLGNVHKSLRQMHDGYGYGYPKYHRY